MVLDTILTYDAANGGVQLVVPPTSLTIKGPSSQTAYLVGHFLDGISVNDCAVTCATNPDWEAAGVTLLPTSTGTAIIGNMPFKLWDHKIPVRGGDVLVLTSTSGANPTHCGLFVEYPGEPGYGPRNIAESVGHYRTYATAAGGTNCAAGTLVQGATNITGFQQGKTYTPLYASMSGAFTTTGFLGIRKLGANYMFITPVPLTDVAQAWEPKSFPKGLFTATQGDAIEVWWSSVTAEQPTANVTFVY